MDRRRGWQDYFDQPPRGALNRAMVDRAQSVMLDSDLLLFLTEAAETPDRPLKHADTEVLSRLRELGRPVLLVLTKVDRTRNKVALLPQIEGLSRELPFEAVVPTSAVKLEGLGQLLDEIVARLPVAPAYYPEDVLTNLPEKFFVAELIREQILLHTRAEIPYSAAVVVDGFDESGPIVRIQSTIHVERPSQKRIVIGRQGEMLKQIGTQARKQIEHLLERRVHLELWVRVTPEWTKDPAAVQRLSAEPVSTGIER